MTLLCCIGIHRWRYPKYNYRFCKRCDKRQTWRPGISIGEKSWWDLDKHRSNT